MAERIVDRLADKILEEGGRELSPCKTDRIILRGGVFKDGKEVKKYTEEVQTRLTTAGLDPYYAEYLVSNYGRQTEEILSRFGERKEKDPEIRLALSELALHN